MIVAALLLVLLAGCKSEAAVQQDYTWNDGYCECGGELIWQGTSSKEHYKCNKCGREYTFDRVMMKGEKNDIQN